MSKKAMDYVDERELVEDRLWRQEVATGEAAVAPAKRAHKDTKHWCKGKVGREHTFVIVIPENAWRRDCRWVENIGDRRYWGCVHVELCQRCRKQFRHAYHWLTDADRRTTLLPEECPNYPGANG